MIQYLPHFIKLQKSLSSEQIEIYKCLTRNNFFKFIDNSNIKIRKITERVFVFLYKNKIIKVIFNVPHKFKSELYYSHCLYEQAIISKASVNGCILILPNYGKSLSAIDKHNYFSHELKHNITEQYILQQNLVLQIVNLHCERLVHNDIKPANIIYNSNCKENKLKYIIIDFGHVSKYESYTSKTNFKSGTDGYKPPKEWCIYMQERLNEEEIYVYMFLKDWYAFSKTLNKFDIESNMHIDFCKFELFEIIKSIQTLLTKFKIKQKPFYITFFDKDLKKLANDSVQTHRKNVKY